MSAVTDVARSVVRVSVTCVGHTSELRRKGWTDRDAVWEDDWLTYIQGIILGLHYMGVPVTHEKGHFWGDMCRLSYESIAHCSLAAAGECAYLAHAADECSRCGRVVTKQRCGFLPNYSGNLLDVVLPLVVYLEFPKKSATPSKIQISFTNRLFVSFHWMWLLIMNLQISQFIIFSRKFQVT